VIAVLLDHYFKRKKTAAETKKIQLQNKITEEITYDQLQKESKQKDIKGKIEILSRLNKLEAEIKNRENKTADDQRKLESLEMIKKEFKTSLIEPENEPKKKLSAEPTKKLSLNKKKFQSTKKKKKKN
jgi:endo-1,4-beta-D-glucanase Y